jgi:hypothetical protein
MWVESDGSAKSGDWSEDNGWSEDTSHLAASNLLGVWFQREKSSYWESQKGKATNKRVRRFKSSWDF